MIHGQITKDNEIEELREVPLKKTLIIILGLCMIFLMISYVFYSNGNEEIILGLIGSTTLEHNRINLPNQTIEFEGNVFISLVQHYVANDGNEIKACFMGDREGDKITLRQIEFPKVHNSYYNYVKADPCPKETLLSVHSHPNRRCRPSTQDMNNYEQLKIYNPDLIVAVLCEQGRFYFYS